eukprot:TRINITY_DN6738_c0_g1_i1.p1 TRINITY_DN6738_c0_g1~~TRINITY_DN6738_c0_g1_i1.p1  ORF type:complete len:713 (-),score=118.88 TRINITY_DN6738_c0_g1_i1:256-2394(-)
MATLPPRKNPTPTKFTRENLTPLETLLQMGFSKQRALKALVATGHKGPQLAADWLLAHVKDPTIDSNTPRDFIIYLCPVGDLKEQLSLFWEKSRHLMGWNGAHNSFPHITLSSSFSCAHPQVEQLVATISKVTSKIQEDLSKTKLNLERYMSPNFFGLFVKKEHESILKQLSIDLCQEIRNLGLKCEPYLKPYHLTLAYQFQPSHFVGLEELAQDIDTGADCGWQLRLYSYENKTAGSDVYKVLYAHVPREPDELELVIGDFIFVTPEEVAKTCDGWVVGVSWLTGSTGYLPFNYVERSAETNAWTLHALLPLISGENCEGEVEPGEGSSSSVDRLMEAHTTAQGSDTIHGRDIELEHLYSKVCKPGRESPAGICDPTNENTGHNSSGEEVVSSTTPTFNSSPRQVFIARHGERVDFTFGSWIPYSFDSEGNYERKDLNMPGSIPKRKRGPEGFARDCPLTAVGSFQALILGEAMKSSGVEIQHVFCSPSLRCVQTCHNILTGLGIAQKVKMNLEPGLFEWLAWYQDSMPDWMDAEELISAGYNIDATYKPYISADELQDCQESCQQFYIRNFFVTQCALQATEEVGGNVLLVAHAGSLDTCTRQLIGKDPRPVNSLMSIVRKVPYCAVAMVEEVINDEDELFGHTSPTPSRYCDGRISPGCVSSVSLLSRSTIRTPAPPPREWRLVNPPFPALTHTSVATFDWNILLDKEQ